MRDFKYTAAYLIPAATLFSLHMRGIFSFTTVLLVFLVIPIIEPFLGNSAENLDSEQQTTRNRRIIFDLLLYLNLPILYGLLVYFGYQIHVEQMLFWEKIGLCLSLGITMGAIGINVAHELGHKDQRYKRVLAGCLLLPSLYMHFTMEHNLGHHKNVGTDVDPASAKAGEPIYVFWLRSMIGTYRNAWKIQQRLLSQGDRSFFSWDNHQLIYLVLQLSSVVMSYLIGGVVMMLMFVACAFISILLLETINYVEHYGLRRQRQKNKRYELVRPDHSWNSNHELGRIMLYELTRHSDHHFASHKKYQNLDDHKHSKQLPFGYPTSMLLSLCPPLWFRIMDKRI